MWCACRYDPRTRQTVRRSLGTADLRAAQIELARFVTQHGEIRDAEPEPHDGRPASGAASRAARASPAAKADFARHSRRLLEHFGDAVIADLTPAAIDGFTGAMRATGRGGSYTDRILDSLRSALSKAHKLGEITAAPAIATVPRDRYERRLPSPARSSAAFWSAADEPHLRMFYVILLNTGARPNAILALTRFQIDFERRLMNLQPPDRDETKKRNPVLPITDALLPALQGATGDFSCPGMGKPLACIKSAWRRCQGAGRAARRTSHPYSRAARAGDRAARPWRAGMGMRGLAGALDPVPHHRDLRAIPP